MSPEAPRDDAPRRPIDTGADRPARAATRRLARLLAAIACAVAMTACGASAATTTGFDGAPLVEIASDSGALTIALRASPSPPIRGVCEFELTITDRADASGAAGAPVDGLTIEVVPWMDAHGHGTSVTPTVTAEGGGKYLVENASLYMAGRWTLRTTIHRPGVEAPDTAEISVDVQ